MRLKLFSSIIASASLVATPVLAQSAAPTTSAAKLSVARASAPVSGERLGEGSGGIIAIALVAGIIAIAVLAAIESGDDNDSISN